MQKSAQREGLLFGVGEIQLVGQERGIKTDAATMVQQLTIFGFQEIRQQRNQHGDVVAGRGGIRNRFPCEVIGAVFSPDGSLLAMGTDIWGNTVLVWNIETLSLDPIKLQVEYEYNAIPQAIESLAFSPNGNWLAIGNYDGSIILWDLKNPALAPIVLRGHQSPVRAIVFSQDGDSIISVSAIGEIWKWEVSDSQNARYEELLDVDVHLNIASFSSDGHWLAVGGDSGPVGVVDMTNLNIDPNLLFGQEDEVNTLTFSPDGSKLASGSFDNTINLWELTQSETEPVVLYELGASFTNVLAFSPDERWLVGGNQDGSIRMWDLNLDSLIKKACSIVGRNFTQAEWAQYFPGEPYRKTCDQWPEGE